MDACVTIKVHIKRVCDQADLDETGMSFEDMVKYLIAEEGLFSISEPIEEHHILSVEVA